MFQMAWNETHQLGKTTCLASPWSREKNKNPQVFVGRTPRLHCYQLCTPFQGWTPGVSFWHQKLGVGLSCNFNGCSKYCVYISGWWDMFEIGIFKLYLYTNVISFCLYVVFLLYHLPFEISDTASCGTTGYHTDFWNCLKTIFDTISG